ncbi:MAG: penicillin-binding protein activator [Kofleriaceae bacterium]
MLQRLFSLVALVLLVSGCPRQTRKTLVPVPDAPSSGSVEARSRFQEARARFLRDGTSAEEFREIVEAFPNDPIVPWAKLYAGIAAVRDRQFEVAAQTLGEVIAANAHPDLTLKAQLFMGITKNYQGDTIGALPLLQRGEPAISDDSERIEWLAAMAYATAASDRPLASLPRFDQLYVRVTPAERALIVARVEQVVAAADVNALRRVFDELDDRNGPGMAAVASRLVMVAEASGNASEAARLREIAGAARIAVGLPREIAGETAASSNTGNANLVGAVMPLGGKQQRVGDAAVAGIGVAAGVSDGTGVAAVEIRPASDPDASVVAVETLARANVIAIVGPIDAASVDAASVRAEGLGVPLLTLSPRPDERGSGRFVFHMMHSAEARARVLARRAVAKGVRTFAVLAPDSGYGKAVTAAFVAELEGQGGTVVTRSSYPPDTKSFAQIASKLGGTWDGVFIPEQADRLALIAPALAAAGKIPKPVGTKKVIGGRAVLLVSTAEGLAPDYLADAGRHSEGALLAPGFYPDDHEPAQQAFLTRFSTTYGRAPGAVEAYAYDAVQLAAAAGAGGRVGLASTLSRGELVGLTGTIKFGADHRRADAGVIYTVVDEAGTLAIRVARQ